MASDWFVKFSGWFLKGKSASVAVNLLDRRFTYNGKITEVTREFVEITRTDGTPFCISYGSIIVATPVDETEDESK